MVWRVLRLTLLHFVLHRVVSGTLVRSNADVMRWPGAYFDMLATHMSASPVGFFTDFITNTRDISTAFSGIDAPGVALNMAIAAADARSNGPALCHPVHMFAIEKDAEASKELSLQPNGPRCIFGDIMRFCSPDLRAKLALETEPYDIDRLIGAIMRPGAVLLTAACQTHEHRRGCLCKLVSTVGHIAGPPCTDFTSWGKCRRLRGPTVIILLVWLLHMSATPVSVDRGRECAVLAVGYTVQISGRTLRHPSGRFVWDYFRVGRHSGQAVHSMYAENRLPSYSPTC